MNLIKFNPFNPINTPSDVFDTFFNNRLFDFVGADQMNALPSVNVIENKDTFEINLAAPGLKKEDFFIQIENDSLIIRAEKKEEKKEEKGKFKRREFNYTSFKRSFDLEEQIVKEDITAEYESGILKVMLPKSKDKTEETTRFIEVS